MAQLYEREEEPGLALFHWHKYLDLVPEDKEVRQHVVDIQKPLLTRKQAEQMAVFDQKVKENQQAPAPGPGTDSSAPPPVKAPAADSTGAPPPPPVVGIFPTPTPSTQLVPVEIAQPSPEPDIATLPK